MTAHLKLADYLLIAEAVLGVPTEHVIRGIASSDVSEAEFRSWIAHRCG